MATKIRGLGRLLVALTLLGWGPLAFAEDYYWSSSGLPGKFSNPNDACDAYAVSETRAGSGRYGVLTRNSETSYKCAVKNSSGASISSSTVSRGGTGCTPPKTYNSETASCETPKDCSSTSGKQITAAQECTFNASLKTYVCKDQIQQDGCLYTGGGGRKCVADLTGGKAICTGDFFGSGETAGQGSEPCTDQSCTPPRDPNVPPADEQCVTNGDLTICHTPQEEGCGTVNGKEGCFQEEPGCGYYNGTYGCYPTDNPKKNCTYFNGKLTCTNPKDPTKVIPESSPDHPKNGGNADGNENNDPKAPGQTGTSPQGSDEGATNEAIGKLGDELGDKIGEGNDLLGSIKGILEGISNKLGELTDGLLGDDYDGSGDGNGDSLEGIGSGLGNDLAGMIGDQLGQAQDEQLASDELSLDKIADNVDGDKWFGENSQVAALLSFTENLLPAATGCNDVSISFSLGQYSTRLVLPVCDLSRIKPLLEWIIYVVTAIGLWNIAYSTLRMENAKAAKGGF